MSSKTNHVGIDVSSKELVLEMKSGKDSSTLKGKFENTTPGHKKLLKFITKYGCYAKVCMEATGVYHFELAVMLAKSENVEVMVVNPKAMKHFGTAIMQRAKTDKVDAHIILEYLLRMEFIRWLAPNENIIQIQIVTRRISQLKKSLIQEENRLSTSEFQGQGGKYLKRSIKKHITQLQKHINEAQQDVSKLIQSDEALKKKYDLLISIKGIADVSASQILAEILTLPDDMAANQWVAFAGLDPRPIESGTSVNRQRKISKRGNKYLRAALYMPAWVAVMHDKNVRAYYEKLVTKGKSKLQSIVAVMRKLLLSIWGILNSEKKWDGEKFYKIENTA